MNYNSSIQWHSGMMLSTEMFSQMQMDMTLRQQIAIKAAMGAGGYGILPDMPLRLEGVFVRRTYEMTGLQCTAVLPSGKILSLDADLKLPISIAKGDADYYVCLEFGKEMRQYEREGVPYAEQEVVLALHTLEELQGLDAMPVKHFVVKDGTLLQDDEYIMPAMDCSSDERIAKMLSAIADSLKTLAEHRNMEHGDCRRALLHYAFMLGSFNMHKRMAEMIGMLQEVEQSLNYYIVDSLGRTVGEVPAEVLAWKDSPEHVPYLNDVRRFMAWLKEYADRLSLIMDKVVIEKPVIDVEAIKKEIHDQLYPELREALYNELLEQLRQKLTEELPEPIIERIKQYIMETTEPELQEKLFDRLRNPLYDDLYEALMKIIQDMLANVEIKQTDTFVPLI